MAFARQNPDRALERVFLDGAAVAFSLLEREFEPAPGG